MDEQEIALRSQLAVDANYRFGSGALHEGASFRIKNRSKKVVSGRVTDFEFNSRVELNQLDQIRLAKISFFWRRLRGHRFLHQLYNRTQRLYAQLVS